MEVRWNGKASKFDVERISKVLESDPLRAACCITKRVAIAANMRDMGVPGHLLELWVGKQLMVDGPHHGGAFARMEQHMGCRECITQKDQLGLKNIRGHDDRIEPGG